MCTRAQAKGKKWRGCWNNEELLDPSPSSICLVSLSDLLWVGNQHPGLWYTLRAYGTSFCYSSCFPGCISALTADLNHRIRAALTVHYEPDADWWFPLFSFVYHVHEKGSCFSFSLTSICLLPRQAVNVFVSFLCEWPKDKIILSTYFSLKKSYF